MRGIAVLVVLASIGVLALGKSSRRPPNIVFILADDMGWNDVGFHGANQIPTPNIDALAYNGIILNQHYTPALCSPSRSAFMTGKFPIHTGMQHLVILENEPWGLGLNEVLLPEYLNKAGYKSHAVGKWHLGFFKKEYTPIHRGFHSHYGYWQGFHDYYNHSVRATYASMDGYDMRRGLNVDWDAQGKYSTDLFTNEAVKLIKEHDTARPFFLYLAHLAPHTGNARDPFQAPDDIVAKFSHIEDPERRVYAAMVSKLDESVGEVIAALRSRSMLDNSIVVFVSDNGAPTHGIHSNRGSNFPFRGMKNSGWEGGVRGVAAVWSPLLKKRQRVSDQLMYVTDWMPTLYSAAGLNVRDLGKIDGVDMWSALSEGSPSPRNDFVYNIDDIDNPYAAVRFGDWKYIIGAATGKANNEWYGETGRGSDMPYDIESIMMSKGGAAISAYLIKKQIQDKINKNTQQNSALDEKEKKQWNLLTEDAIYRLREEAEVICPYDNSTEVESECNPLESPCLFNLREDPCERVNLFNKNGMMVEKMEALLGRYRKSTIKARNLPGEEIADPLHWNNTWSPWHDEMEKSIDFIHSDYLAPILSAIGIIIIIIGLIFATPRYFFANQVVPESPKTISIFTLTHPDNEIKKSSTDN